MNDKILIREDKNGTKYYHHRCRCAKCGGTGMIDYYRPVNGGVCFDCDGSGIVEYDTKEYTPEYEEKLRQQAEKRRERQIAKEREKAPELNAEFFKKNGFNPEGKTYVVLGDTYSIKDELKAQGAKWDNLSRHWHMPTPPEGHDYLELSVDDMYDANYAGVYDWRSWKSFDDEAGLADGSMDAAGLADGLTDATGLADGSADAAGLIPISSSGFVVSPIVTMGFPGKPTTGVSAVEVAGA